VIRILTNILTGYDNQTYDTGRFLAFLYFVSTILFTAWDLHHGNKFDPQAYLVGGGGFLAGLGVYLFGDKSPLPTTAIEKKEAKDAAAGTTRE
jgi:hypothetical protein